MFPHSLRKTGESRKAQHFPEAVDIVEYIIH
jgi:hypothetical protein